jgi:HPt (histidine-containing phosphotransfer) domain-containing protein
MIMNMDERLYRLDYLNEISGGDSVFVRQMVIEFVSIAPATLSELVEYIKAAEYTNLRLKIHQFGPQLEYLGLTEERNMADKVESLCVSQGSWELIRELVEKISQQTKKAINQLRTDYLNM